MAPLDASGVPDLPNMAGADLASREAPSLVAWAAAGALRELALAEPHRATLLKMPLKARAESCLCGLSRSPDSLERSKWAWRTLGTSTYF